MMTCDLEGFFCKTHKCGAVEGGELKLCLKEGCPHCGAPKKKMTGRTYRRLVEEHGRAQEAVIRWEDKLGRALSRLQAARGDERKLRLRLEKAEREGVTPEAEETEEQSMLAAGFADQYGSD
jgi:hypothetical protein